MSPSEPKSEHAFLSGGGEMGALIRAHDWSVTPLGPIEGWSAALRMQVSFLLANRFPQLLWWGPTFCSIYNDAYAPILGAKHPWALGRPVNECWSEIWDVLQPLVETPFLGGPPTWIEDLDLEIHRHGYLEEGHFTVAYSPVPDESAPRGIGGVVATVHEITSSVFGKRRMAALRDLGSRASEAKTAEQACDIAASTLAAYGRDLPFVLLYLLENDGARATLQGAAGVERGAAICPPSVALGADEPKGWPLSAALLSGSMVVVERLGERFEELPGAASSDQPHTAVVLAIPSSKAHEPAALLVAGVSPRIQLDESYRGYFDLLRTQLATAIGNARAYEEERKRAEALAEMDRVKTAFFSNVSHEFRTPLTLMLGPIEDLLDQASELPPAALDQIEVVHRNGLRLLRLVNALLDFSRIEAGRVRALYRPTDVSAFTAELAGVFRSAVERAGMRLTVDCPPLGEPVFVDRDMWEKVVLNLLSNAFKFTFEGGIHVALGKQDGAAELCVTDTGTGVPAEEMPRLFERFHRIENARGRTHEGSGIGLALVQELVKLHGGSISAESALGRGTTFTIRVPLGSAHLPADQIGAADVPATRAGSSPYVEEALRWLPDGESQRSEAASDGVIGPTAAERYAARGDAGRTRPCVLVVDDNADMRQYAIRLLTQHYRIVAAADGEAALAIARQELPDLVLSDVMMPRLDGFGLLQALRADERTRDIPVILLSARAGEESRVEGVASGADDYLTKPFSARELLARVAAHLQMSRMRSEAGAALRESESALREAQRLAHIGSWQWDAVSDACSGSDELRHIFGLEPNQPLPAFELQDGVFYPHESWVLLKEAVAQSLQTGVGYTLELEALRRGKPFWLTTRSEVLRGPDGKVSGLRGTVQDITERKQLELERLSVIEREREARTAAERVAQLKDEFLATLSHELRNPLNSVLGWAQILEQDSASPERVRSAAEVIQRNARAQAQLISDLLDLSRIAAGKMRLEVQSVDLPAVLAAAIESMQPTADAKGVLLESAVEPSAGAVRGDPARLQQVVWNLLSNAVKFTPRGGRIVVAAERKGTRVELRVSDTGEGIATEFLPHIFERFRQADASTARRHGGLGIGLALVKQLVELHGGRVSASSAGQDRGSTFAVELPGADASGALAAPTWVDSRSSSFEIPGYAPAQLEGARALVVDDDPDAASMVRRILEECQVLVDTARSTQEALAALESGSFDVVISDIGMPGRDGYELAREMRARGIATPAVALTAFARGEDRSKALLSGYQAHVSKPIETVVLLATVGELLRDRARVRKEA